jgi:hypothetical protein
MKPPAAKRGILGGIEGKTPPIGGAKLLILSVGTRRFELRTPCTRREAAIVAAAAGRMVGGGQQPPAGSDETQAAQRRSTPISGNPKGHNAAMRTVAR